MKTFLISAFADEYASDFEEQLSALNRLGVDYVEPRALLGKNVSDLTREEVKTAAKMLKSHGVGVSSVGSPIGKVKLSDDLDEHLKKAERLFQAANEWNTRNVRVFSFYPAEGENISDREDAVFEWMEKLLTLARRYGVTLCHENEAGIYGYRPETCETLLSRFGGELKAVFDMGNFALAGYDPFPVAYQKLAPYIEYFHIKDATAAGAIVPPGEGEAKIKEILSFYKQSGGKQTFVTLEPHLKIFSGLKDMATAKFTNPFEYPDKKAAFTDALNRLKTILSEVER